MVNRARRHLEEVFQERSQKAHRAELESKAKAMVIPSPPRDALAIRVIEMERPGELLRGRVTGIAAIARLLVLGYKGDRHGGPVASQGLRRTPPFCTPTPALGHPDVRPVQKSFAYVVQCARSFAKPQDRWRGASMKVGYARVSTDDQHLDMPLDVLQQAERRGVGLVVRPSGVQHSEPWHAGS
jgi:hypothetical protein